MNRPARRSLDFAEHGPSAGRPVVYITDHSVINNMTPSKVTATHRRRKDARPQELLDAALLLFVEKGFSATRIEQVAARAGVSKGTLYLYFPSKAELFKAVVRVNLSALIVQAQQMADRFEGSAAELLRTLMHGWWQRVGSTSAGAIFKIILAEAGNFPELAQFYRDEVVRPAARLLGSAVGRGIRRGEFRDVPVHTASRALMSPLLLLAVHQHAFSARAGMQSVLHPIQLIDMQIDLMLHGLLARAGSTS